MAVLIAGAPDRDRLVGALAGKRAARSPGSSSGWRPTLWLAAVGFLAGAVFRGPAAAGGLVAMLWIVQQFFADVAQEQQLVAAALPVRDDPGRGARRTGPLTG